MPVASPTACLRPPRAPTQRVAAQSAEVGRAPVTSTLPVARPAVLRLQPLPPARLCPPRPSGTNGHPAAKFSSSASRVLLGGLGSFVSYSTYPEQTGAGYCRLSTSSPRLLHGGGCQRLSKLCWSLHPTGLPHTTPNARLFLVGILEWLRAGCAATIYLSNSGGRGPGEGIAPVVSRSPLSPQGGHAAGEPPAESTRRPCARQPAVLADA